MSDSDVDDAMSVKDIAVNVLCFQKPRMVDDLVEKLGEDGILLAEDLLKVSKNAMEMKLASMGARFSFEEISHVVSIREYVENKRLRTYLAWLSRRWEPGNLFSLEK